MKGSVSVSHRLWCFRWYKRRVSVTVPKLYFQERGHKWAGIWAKGLRVRWKDKFQEFKRTHDALLLISLVNTGVIPAVTHSEHVYEGYLWCWMVCCSELTELICPVTFCHSLVLVLFSIPEMRQPNKTKEMFLSRFFNEWINFMLITFAFLLCSCCYCHVW